MPQFDKITFFNQILFIILVFASFYFTILKFVLPKIALVLKTRKKITKTSKKTENFVLNSLFGEVLSSLIVLPCFIKSFFFFELIKISSFFLKNLKIRNFCYSKSSKISKKNPLVLWNSMGSSTI